MESSNRLTRTALFGICSCLIFVFGCQGDIANPPSNRTPQAQSPEDAVTDLDSRRVEDTTEKPPSSGDTQSSSNGDAESPEDASGDSATPETGTSDTSSSAPARQKKTPPSESSSPSGPENQPIQECRRSASGCESNERPEKPEKLSNDETIQDLVAEAKKRVSRVGAPKFREGTWWKMAWKDDFEGPTSAKNSYCYDEVKPRCMDNWWHSEKCRDTPEIRDNLGDLNKCVWSLYDYHNYMGEKGLNAFDPSAVKVEDGELVLTSRSVDRAEYDCGRQIEKGNYQTKTTKCPFVSGGIESRAFPNKGRKGKGYIQKYGRFEVRAKLPDGKGSWPAHWLLSQDGGWPHKGEIDIMEMWAHQWPKNYQAGLYGGNPAIEGSGDHPGSAHNAVDLQRNVTRQPTKDWGDTFVEDYNTYAVEWTPNKMSFYFNNIHLDTLYQGEGTYDDKQKMCHRLDMPDTPFYMILNNTITSMSWPSQQSPFRFPGNDLEEAVEKFEKQKHHIDHVKSYRQCKTDGDFCPWGGTFNGRRCAVIAVPESVDHRLRDGRLTYEPENNGCPKGGYLENGRCLLYEVPSSSSPDIKNGILFTDSACMESTLSSYCSTPCNGLGKFTGYRCKLGKAPSDLEAYVEDGEFRYKDKGILDWNTESSDCRSEDTYLGESDGCKFADVPDGRTATVEDSTFYLEPTCSTTASLMNCPTPCGWGGDFDGQNCHIRKVPPGTEPFIHNRGFYYKAKSSDPSEACPEGGSYDGSNCYLGYKAPEGSNPFIYEGHFYIEPECDHSPDWQNLHRKIFKKKRDEACSAENFPDSPITYRSHVRFDGWSNWATEGQTVGQPDGGWQNRLQGLQLHLPYNLVSDDSLRSDLKDARLRCRAHVAGKGWMDWVTGSDICGKTGRRLEAVRLKLESESNSSSGRIEYRVYVKDAGWTNWQSNGSVAGTTDGNNRLEAIEIKLNM